MNNEIPACLTSQDIDYFQTAPLDHAIAAVGAHFGNQLSAVAGIAELLIDSTHTSTETEELATSIRECLSTLQYLNVRILRGVIYDRIHSTPTMDTSDNLT